MPKDTEKPQELSYDEVKALIEEKSKLLVAEVQGDPIAKARNKEIRRILSPLTEEVARRLTGSTS